MVRHTTAGPGCTPFRRRCPCPPSPPNPAELVRCGAIGRDGCEACYADRKERIRADARAAVLEAELPRSTRRPWWRRPGYADGSSISPFPAGYLRLAQCRIAARTTSDRAPE